MLYRVITSEGITTFATILFAGWFYDQAEAPKRLERWTTSGWCPIEVLEMSDD